MPLPPSSKNGKPAEPAAHVRAAMAAAQAKPAAAQAKPAAGALPRILPLAPPRLPAAVAPAPQRVVQRAIDFDSSLNARWIPDKKNCQVCKAEIGWNKRHHCRVCGRSVCGVCAGDKFQVLHRVEKGGRSTSARPSSERVCVDCVLNRKLALAGGVAELTALRAAARAGAGNRVIALDWERFDGGGKYDPGYAMVVLDPGIRDPFSTYLFELTNAAQAGRLRKPKDFDDPEKYAFFVELLEYNGTRTHQRVARAINAANLGFRVTEMFPGNLPDLDAFNVHYEAQQHGHTDRYRKQWKDAQPETVRRGSFSKETAKAPARGRGDSF